MGYSSVELMVGFKQTLNILSTEWAAIFNSISKIGNLYSSSGNLWPELPGEFQKSAECRPLVGPQPFIFPLVRHTSDPESLFKLKLQRISMYGEALYKVLLVILYITTIQLHSKVTMCACALNQTRL